MFVIKYNEMRDGNLTILPMNDYETMIARLACFLIIDVLEDYMHFVKDWYNVHVLYQIQYTASGFSKGFLWGYSFATASLG